MQIIFEFVGGPHDGKTVVGGQGDQDEADRYYALTYHGSIGQRFRVASEYAVETLAAEQLQEERPHHFQKHVYEVTERMVGDDEIFIRAEYVPRAVRQR